MALTCEKLDTAVDQGEATIRTPRTPRGSAGFVSDIARTAKLALLAVVALAATGGSASAKSSKKAKAAESIYFVADPDKNPKGVFIKGQTTDAGLLDITIQCEPCVLEVRCPEAVVEDEVPFERKKDRVVFKLNGGDKDSVRGKTFGVTCKGDESPGRLLRIPDYLPLIVLNPAALPAPVADTTIKPQPSPAFVPAAGQEPPPPTAMEFDALDVKDAEEVAQGAPKGQAASHGRWSLQVGAVSRYEFGSSEFLEPLGAVAGFSREKVFGPFGFGMELGWNRVSQGLATAGGFSPLDSRESLSGHAGYAVAALRFPYELNKGGALSFELEGTAKLGGAFLYVNGQQDAAVDSSGALADVGTLTTPTGIVEACGGVSATHKSSGVGLVLNGCGGINGPRQTKAAGKSEIVPGADVSAMVRVTLP